MGDDTVGSQPNTLPNSLATKFWDLQQAEGTWKAILFLHKETNADLLDARSKVPLLIEEGNKRGIDMINFLKEFEDALGTGNGVDQLPVDSSDEAGSLEDADESAEARQPAEPSEGAEEVS